MTDNVDITPGTGKTIATDDVGGVQYQRVKLMLGPDGTATADADGTAARGINVDPRPNVVTIQVTPTVSTTPAYTAKDQVGGLMTFSNAARASGGSCMVQAVQINDHAQQMKDLELLLFDRSITVSSDNAIFAPSDADMKFCRGSILISSAFYSDLSTNSVATVNGVGLAIVLNGTDLFGVLVARGTPTYVATTDIVVTLTLGRD